MAPPSAGRRPIGVPKTLLCAATIVLPLPTEDGSKLEGGGPIFSPGSRTLAAVNCLFWNESSIMGSTPSKRQNMKFHFHLASKTKISSSSQLIYKLILNTCTHQPLYYSFVGLACFPQVLYFCVFGFYVSVQQIFRSQPFPVGFTLVSELGASILKLGIFSERWGKFFSMK